MFKKILIGLLFLMIISCTKKEDNSHLLSKYIQIDKVINTGFQFRGSQRSFKFALDNDQIFMMPVFTKEGLTMKVYNLKNKKVSREFFNYDKSIADTLKYSIGSEPYDFEVTDKYIYAIIVNYLLVIDKKDSKNTYLTVLKEPFQTVNVFDGFLLLSRAYNYSSKRAKSPVQIAKYDLKSRTLTSFLNPVSDCIEFSYFFPATWIDISNSGEIVFSHTLQPNHYLYDINFELKQELMYKPKNWKNVDMTELNKIRNSKTSLVPQVLIRSLEPIDDSGCRVVSVNFANDSTLLIFYSAQSKSEKSEFIRYCNVWKKKNDKWVLFDKELKDGYPDVSAILSKDNFPFSGSFQKIKFYKNKAYYINVTPNAKTLLQFGKKFGDVKKDMNKCYAEETLYHQLLIFNCKF